MRVCFAVVDRTGNVTVYEAVRLYCTAACGRWEEKNDVLMWIVVSFVCDCKPLHALPLHTDIDEHLCHRKCVHVHRLDQWG